ncbi:MAG TPA: MBL fold metallo-hydrolase [Devosia sp.]|jgi:glyoxylase-like metal-dependent hydrolase (beta-lactamase superfamily II)|uniref:MBL fold metallo-hydrolase n=1 Tax=Devosia sp. TaxID=1871048 RepID=UPI002DDD7EA8|nr:MBL fold metallo-hydrolase [Devosia sp.]HEV2517570.1 MBL fold metallo-hydrolase [Devosia sp.]
MAGQTPALSFNTTFDAETGRPVAVAAGLVRVTAPNAGPYTFKGTNSFIIGTARVAIVDPGPDDDLHLEALTSAIAGRPVEAILLTHTHLDHSALASKLKAATGAPVWSGGKHRLSRPGRLFEINAVGGDSDWRLTPDRVLEDGEQLAVDGVALEVIATPGHCANHLAFGLTGTPWLLTGDHIMGWNSTLVSVPDGSMADYLHSLEKVIGLGYAHYVPAHGGTIEDGPDHARALLAHRQERNRQVVAAVNAGARKIGELLATIYPPLAQPLHGAALMTLKAHVEYLVDRGLIGATYGPFGTTLFPSRA